MVKVRIILLKGSRKRSTRAWSNKKKKKKTIGKSCNFRMRAAGQLKQGEKGADGGRRRGRGKLKQKDGEVEEKAQEETEQMARLTKRIDTIL